RDTKNPASSMRYHSLLEDMYGNTGWESEIPPGNKTPVAAILGSLPATPALAAAPNDPVTKTELYTVRWPDDGKTPTPTANVTGGQILEFDVLWIKDLYGNFASAYQTSPLDDAYAGQVLTFTSGAARGISTRILNSFHPTVPDPTDPTKKVQ